MRLVLLGLFVLTLVRRRFRFRALALWSALFAMQRRRQLPFLSWLVPPSLRQLERTRARLLDDLLGSSGKLLVHLDEHKKMCADSDLRRASMSFLLFDDRILPVPTYTEPLGTMG